MAGHSFEDTLELERRKEHLNLRRTQSDVQATDEKETKERCDA